MLQTQTRASQTNSKVSSTKERKHSRKAKSSRQMPDLTKRQLRKIHSDFLNDPDVFALLNQEFKKDHYQAAMDGCSQLLLCMTYAPEELMEQIGRLINEGAAYAYTGNSR